MNLKTKYEISSAHVGARSSDPGENSPVQKVAESNQTTYARKETKSNQSKVRGVQEHQTYTEVQNKGKVTLHRNDDG